MISGVQITKLKQIPDERGKIMHMLRSDESHFLKFGEIYFSCIEPQAIKGWHLHTRMILNYAVPYGKIKLVLYDDRDNSPTKGELQEFFLGPDNYLLLTIPSMIWNGFKGLGTTISILANCATEPHDPKEIIHKEPFSPDIPYDWALQNA